MSKLKKILDIIYIPTGFRNLSLACFLVFLFIFLVCIVTTDASTLFQKKPSPPPLNLQSEISKFKVGGYWFERIKERGGETAYQELKREYAPYPYAITHNIGHLFGDALYRNLGLDSIAYCEDTYGFGIACYHQVIINAVVEKGTSVISELANRCVKKYGELPQPCAHGIGHGVMEFFGDDEQALVSALEVCEEFGGGLEKTQSTISVYCYHGALMQFSRLLSVVGEEPVRSVDSKKPLAPCSTVVPERFKHNCYVSLGEWHLTYDQTDGKYERFAASCAEAPDPYKGACYSGLGMYIATKAFDVEETIEKCSSFTDSFVRASCSIGAAWAFLDFPNDQKKVAKLCKRAPVFALGRCLDGNIKGFSPSGL